MSHTGAGGSQNPTYYALALPSSCGKKKILARSGFYRNHPKFRAWRGNWWKTELLRHAAKEQLNPFSPDAGFCFSPNGEAAVAYAWLINASELLFWSRGIFKLLGPLLRGGSARKRGNHIGDALRYQPGIESHLRYIVLFPLFFNLSLHPSHATHLSIKASKTPEIKNILKIHLSSLIYPAPFLRRHEQILIQIQTVFLAESHGSGDALSRENWDNQIKSSIFFCSLVIEYSTVPKWAP